MGLNKSKGNCCIYSIYSKSNKKTYIGSTNDYNKRKRRHISDLKLNRHHSILLQRHFNKYGIDDISFELLEYVKEEKDLITIEQKYIDKYNPSFNILTVAGSPLGRICSDETKEKLRKINLGKKLSKDTKRKMSKSRMGKKRKPFTKETLKRMSESRSKRKIINTNTGAIYEGYNNVPIDMKTSTLRAQLIGQNSNKTIYKLV